MKIRSLHPEFFTDAKVAQLSYPARILYAGLWCHSDDYGRGRWLPKAIEGDIFPRDQVNIEALLGELQALGMVRRYDVAGDQFYEIRAWEKYQTPKYRAKTSIPEPPDPKTPGHTDPGQIGDNPGRTSPEFGKGEVEVEVEVEGVIREPKGSRPTNNGNRTDLFEAFYQAWHQRPFADGTKLTKSERGRLNAAAKEAADLGASADEVLTRANRYRRDWPAIECTPQALLSNWTRFDEASSPEPFDPDNCQHPEDRQAVIEGDTYCGACGKELG